MVSHATKFQKIMNNIKQTNYDQKELPKNSTSRFSSSFDYTYELKIIRWLITKWRQVAPWAFAAHFIWITIQVIVILTFLQLF